MSFLSFLYKPHYKFMYFLLITVPNTVFLTSSINKFPFKNIKLLGTLFISEKRADGSDNIFTTGSTSLVQVLHACKDEVNIENLGELNKYTIEFIKQEMIKLQLEIYPLLHSDDISDLIGNAFQYINNIEVENKLEIISSWMLDVTLNKEKKLSRAANFLYVKILRKYFTLMLNMRNSIWNFDVLIGKMIGSENNEYTKEVLISIRKDVYKFILILQV